jgi:hypothetical protein
MKSLFVLMALLTLAGCATRQSTGLDYKAISVYTTGRLNLQSYQAPPVRNAFSTREQVVAVVRSTDPRQRMVLVEFLNAETGAVVSKQVIPSDAGMVRFCGPTFLLPSGSYVVKVSADGVLLDAQNFSVHGY